VRIGVSSGVLVSLLLGGVVVKTHRLLSVRSESFPNARTFGEEKTPC